MPSLPEASKPALAYRLAEFQRREFSLRGTLERQFRRYFEDYRHELERHFAQFFVVPYPDMTAPKVWSTALAPPGLTMVLQDQFNAGLAEVVEEAQTALTDDLTEGFLTGYEHGLWLLDMAGVDISDLPEAADPDEVEAFLLDNGIEGATYLDRLGVWAGVGSAKVAQILASSLAAGLTLDETMRMYTGAMNTVAGGIGSLGGNELFRAMALGAALAYGLKDEDEVWVTEEDELVCPICLPLHLTVTELQPITDTHPSCRCQKVPRSMASRRVSFTPFSTFATRQG